jgi:hypothetical protein
LRFGTALAGHDAVDTLVANFWSGDDCKIRASFLEKRTPQFKAL